MTVSEFLAEKKIKTTQDLYTFLRSRIIEGQSECNYDIMVRVWGESIADKVMRLLEVTSWKFDPMFAKGKGK